MARRRLSRSNKRKIALIAVLIILLSLMGVFYVNFLATKKIGFDIPTQSGSTVVAPTFLYSFAGKEPNQLMRPLGVMADGDYVWVTDSVTGVLMKFREDGTQVGVYGKRQLVTPLYIAKNPKDGLIYVTDRRTRQIVKFDESGKLVGIFEPHLPKDQRPTFTTVEWAPVAIGFASDGTMYVTDILKGHRLLIFTPDGKFKRSVGDAGMPKTALEGPELFQFPNSIKVHGDEVWVADSNNRRVQVFTLKGDFKKIVDTSGLPRGLDFLPRLKGRTKDSPALWAVVDTLAHDATIWDVNGKKMVGFGTQGVMDGQFSYPNDLSVGPQAKIFIADTYNARVQVWGWPAEVAPVSLPPLPQYWPYCFSPLLLLPLLLLFRKKRFVATVEFVDAMLLADAADTMPDRRRRWLATEACYEALKDKGEGDYAMSELLEPTEVSESDVRALIERFEIDHESASILALAQRSKLLCAEDPELRRMARMLEIDAVDSEEFMQRFARTTGRRETDDEGPKLS